MFSRFVDDSGPYRLEPFPAAMEISKSRSPANDSIGNASFCQASNPPAKGRTRVIPARLSCSATRALVASFGQLQYKITS